MNEENTENIKDSKLVYGMKKYTKDAEPGFYRVSRDVVVRVVKNKLFSGVVRVDDVPVEIEEGINEIYLPKIPLSVVTKIHNFFRYVYAEFSSEAIVLIWYNFNTRKWAIEVPEQKVSGASCDYDRDQTINDKLISGGFTFVGTIHSHGTMSAFHSGTDDKDEFNFDGLHITFGKVNNPVPEFACRFVMKDLYLKREPEEVLEVPTNNGFPSEWKSKIKKSTFGGTVFGTRRNLPTKPMNSWWDDDDDDKKKTNKYLSEWM